MIWDEYLSHPTFLIAPALGAVAGCVLGYYAALRNRWQTSFVLLVAFLILLAMSVAWVYPWPMEDKRAVVIHAFGLSVPTVLPFLVSGIWMSGEGKVSARTLMSLEAAAGLFGVLVYPFCAALCGYVMWLLKLL